MASSVEVIEKSMGQTDSCMDMIKGLIKRCDFLIDQVKELKVENEKLKKNLREKQ